MTPTPSIDDLTWVFEDEPVPENPDGPIPGGGTLDWRRDWPFTSVTFRSVRGDDVVELGINPGYEWVSITVSRRGEPVLTVETGDVQTVQIERLHGREEVHVTFRQPRVEMLRLVMKPAVSLHWRVLRSVSR
jgi:hypothetical protein